eukprot:scaffold3595_cov235-Ochromonas_danica.AAC.29
MASLQSLGPRHESDLLLLLVRHESDQRALRGRQRRRRGDCLPAPPYTLLLLHHLLLHHLLLLLRPADLQPSDSTGALRARLVSLPGHALRPALETRTAAPSRAAVLPALRGGRRAQPRQSSRAESRPLPPAAASPAPSYPSSSISFFA